MTKLLFRTAAVVLLILLAGCGHDDQAPSTVISNSAPDAAVMTQVKMLRAGDIDGLIKASLPPADYQILRKKIKEYNLTRDRPITDQDRKKFTDALAQITAPDAEQKLFKQIEPKLHDFNKKYRAQLPMYIGMGQTAATTTIDKSKDLSADQKQQAKDILAAVAQWMQNTDWGDKDKAMQAIAVVTDTVRKLDLKTLDQMLALNYQQAMDKYGQVWGGLNKVFAIYGLDINAALDSVKASTRSNQNHVATVYTSYTLFGKPRHSQVVLIERNGRWYNRDMLEKIEKSFAEDKAAKTTSSVVPTATSAG